MTKKILVVLTLLLLLSVAAVPGYAQAECEETYTVQADDWLSKLADRFFGTYLAYPAIVDATNAAANSDEASMKLMMASLER